MSRFPFGIPNSWFQIAYSDEVKPGELQTVHFLDRDLVLFRGEDGKAGVLDPYCPHIGAHFGHGGTVVDNAVQCPFHKWRFNAEGTCVGIPYTDKIPSLAKAGAWHTREVNGLVMVWHDAEGRPPAFEIPAIPEWGDEDWTSSYEKYSWTIRTHPQDIMENAIDWEHFTSVHGMDPPRERSSSFDGPMFYWNIGTRKDVATMDGASDELFMEAQNWGLGYDWLRYTGMFSTIIVTGLTPIDSEFTKIHFGVIGKKDGRSDEETRTLLKAYMDDQSMAIQQDFEIWEHKGYRTRPVLCDADGPIGQFRNWTKQFYPEGAPGT